MSRPVSPPLPRGDLTVTALYTSETWVWGGFDQAELLATPEARSVFRVTNTFLALGRLLHPRHQAYTCSRCK